MVETVAPDHRERGELRSVVELTRLTARPEFGAPQRTARNDSAGCEGRRVHVTGHDAGGDERRIRDARAGIEPITIPPGLDSAVAEVTGAGNDVTSAAEERSAGGQLELAHVRIAGRGFARLSG